MTLSPPAPHAAGMRRLATNAGIAGYLLALFAGLAMHGLNTAGKHSLPAYFVVWDMFCQWNGYEARVRYIAEGQSGQRYDLNADALGPHLHGRVARDHYDFGGQHYASLARMAAERTAHEPLTRIAVVEENWSKQFNMSPTLYEQTHGRPLRPTVHRSVRLLVSPTGEPIEAREPWLAAQNREATMANPVLKAESRRGRPLYAASGE